MRSSAHAKKREPNWMLANQQNAKAATGTSRKTCSATSPAPSSGTILFYSAQMTGIQQKFKICPHAPDVDAEAEPGDSIDFRSRDRGPGAS
jgi:hypothetical protein